MRLFMLAMGTVSSATFQVIQSNKISSFSWKWRSLIWYNIIVQGPQSPRDRLWINFSGFLCMCSFIYYLISTMGKYGEDWDIIFFFFDIKFTKTQFLPSRRSESNGKSLVTFKGVATVQYHVTILRPMHQRTYTHFFMYLKSNPARQDFNVLQMKKLRPRQV